MLKTEKGDLLSDSYKDFVIFHQCNCVTKDSRGLCKSIFDAFPESNDYIKPIKRQPGTIQSHKVKDRVIVNAYAQRYPGFSKFENDSYKLRLEWFDQCLKKLKQLCDKEKYNKIAIPEFIGCGLAGGDWSIYQSQLISFAQENPSLEVRLVSFSAKNVIKS